MLMNVMKELIIVMTTLRAQILMVHITVLVTLAIQEMELIVKVRTPFILLDEILITNIFHISSIHNIYHICHNDFRKRIIILINSLPKKGGAGTIINTECMLWEINVILWHFNPC